MLISIGISFLLCICATGHRENFHIFYYVWYGNPQHDGKYLHWNHNVLPHWREEVTAQYPEVGTYHNPPDHIHSPFYPLRGCYSSSDESLIDEHFAEISSIGVGVVVISWWGRPDHPNTHDSQNVNTDGIVPKLLRCAEKHNLKIALHLEPYPGRDYLSVRDDIVFLINSYGSSAALYRRASKTSSTSLPFFYIYDSYHIDPQHWAQLLTADGEHTIRKTEYDSVLIGLWLNSNDGGSLLRGGFDGYYTYFASVGMSYGSTLHSWSDMAKWGQEHNQIFIASVGPGYSDERIRPWNKLNNKDREGGAYLDRMMEAAKQAPADIISITSYNEWGEGTQIEPAIIKPTYHDYGNDPYFYLQKTKLWLDIFEKSYPNGKEDL